jgi:hypothetical protein
MFSVMGQPSMLCFLIICQHWLADSYYAMREYAEFMSWIGIGGAAIWLLVVSLMFVASQSDTHELLQTNPMFRFLQLFLSQVAFLPIVFCLLSPSLFCKESEIPPWHECQSLIALCVYLLTSQMLSSDCGILAALPMNCGIDVRYAPVYLMGAQLLDVCVIACPLVAASDRTQLLIAMVCAGCSFLWACVYYCTRSMACCVPHITALRAGGSLAVVWVSASLLLKPRRNMPMVFCGLTACAIGACLAAMYVRWSDRERRKRVFEASGIIEAVSCLAEVKEDLCVRDVVLGGWAESKRRQHWERELRRAHTAKSLAWCLLGFEEHILAERLSDEFLSCRSTWRSRVKSAVTFPDLSQLTEELRQSLRLPSTLPRLRQCTAGMLGRWDLSEQILEFLVGHKKLLALFPEALLAQPSASPKRFGSLDMALHCDRARVAVDSVLKKFKGSSLARSSLTPSLRKPALSTRQASWRTDEADHDVIHVAEELDLEMGIPSSMPPKRASSETIPAHIVGRSTEEAPPQLSIQTGEAMVRIPQPSLHEDAAKPASSVEVQDCDRTPWRPRRPMNEVEL